MTLTPQEIQDLILNSAKTEINITEDGWKTLNKELSRIEIKQAISDCIINNNIDIPIKGPDRQQALEEYKLLCDLDATQFITDDSFYAKYDYIVPANGKYIKGSNIGNKASNYFHFKERMGCNSITSPSPERTWATEKFRLTLLNGLWSLKYKKVDTRSLSSLIVLKKYVASQFKPSVAKAMYQYFEAKNVLDFSSGWGDRLAAFCATDSTVSYVGIDPNTKLHTNYNRQIKAYKTTKKINMINKAAEDVDFPIEVGPVDFIFTSPPYFDIERYTYDDNQSWVRYKKVDNWNKNFLFKVLEKCCNCLVSGGHITINISDVYSGHQINHMCDPMINFMATIPNMKFVGFWGMAMALRPNAKHKGKGKNFAEPIFIWKKS